MRITPLAVHEQTFRMGFRGFDPVEVDAFLQRVADELERLIEERDALTEEIEKEREARQTLEETLSAARTLQEGILEQAQREAEVLTHQAQLRADRILAEGNEELVRVRRELRELKERRDLWLSELEVMAGALHGWVIGKAGEAVESPPLIVEEGAEEEAPDEEE